MVYFPIMPLPPQKFREAVFQILYSQDFAPELEEIIPFMMGELKTTRRAMLDAQVRVTQVLAKCSEIDPLIAESSTEYTFDRISRVEKTILRLGLFELLHDPSIPPKVAIAEAIRLCRKFGTPESSQFVNAILDGVYKKHAAPAAEEPLPV
jgi:N utilization substance protein B